MKTVIVLILLTQYCLTGKSFQLSNGKECDVPNHSNVEDHYIWDVAVDKSRVWFSYFNASIPLHTYETENVQAVFDIEKDLLIDFIPKKKQALLQVVKSNHAQFSSDRHMREAFYYDFFDMDKEHHTMRIAEFHDVRTNNYGTIVNSESDKCDYVRNGGCVYMHHGKLYKFNGPILNLNTSITIGSGASGTWHFPMEAVVALAALNDSMLQNTKIIIPNRQSFSLNWLTLLGVKLENIIDHENMQTKTLYVPEMGLCAAPYLVQVYYSM
jgi:hypothetical protein